MWQAITYVSSGLTLVAFLIAVGAWILKAKTDEKAQLIKSAPAQDRADLVRNALEFFHVDAGNLTKDAQYKLALEQIRARGRRFGVAAGVVMFLALLAAGVVVFALSQQGTESPATPPLTEATYAQKVQEAACNLTGRVTRAQAALQADTSPSSILEVTRRLGNATDAALQSLALQPPEKFAQSHALFVEGIEIANTAFSDLLRRFPDVSATLSADDRTTLLAGLAGGTNGLANALGKLQSTASVQLALCPA